jgi:glycosyltransferase involved in cell wall biosynthesis
VKPIPVIFCTDGIFPHTVGGMQRHSRLLVEALARTGAVALTVVHPHVGIDPFPDFPEIKCIAVAPMPGERPYFLELRDYSKRVLEIVLQHPDHLVYSQGLSLWAGFGQVARRTIVNPHGLEPYQTLDWKTWAKTWLFRLVETGIFRRAARVVSLGGHLTDILRRVMSRHHSARIVVLPNATNPVTLPEGYAKRRANGVGFLFAGRFASNKGIDILLAAAQILHDRGYTGRFRVNLVGKGPLWEDLQAQYTLPDVHFLGFVPDEGLDALYLEDDVFVLPTLFEGMPTVVLEAMARAMPILVTDVGATLELVGPENGRIVPKRDAQALAQAMAELIELDDAAFAALSAASLAKFQARFTWEAVADSHVQLFRALHAELSARS